MTLVAVVLTIGGLTAIPALSQQQEMVLAFVPGLDAQAVLASGSRVARMLEVATGYKIKAVVPTSYAATIVSLCASRADMAFLAPFAYVIGHLRCGVDVRLVSIRNGKPFNRSQILYRNNLPVRQLADLKGRRFAFVDPASTSGYLFPAAMIKRATGLLPAQFFSQVLFAGGHDQVVLAVYQGRVDAGATFADELDPRRRVMPMLPDVMDKVQILMYSQPIPNDTVSFRQTLSEGTKTRITRALVRIAETPPGGEALLDLYQIQGFADLSDLNVKYKLNVHSWDDYFVSILENARFLGIDLEELIRPH